jgi:hypothetical protein
LPKEDWKPLTQAQLSTRTATDERLLSRLEVMILRRHSLEYADETDTQLSTALSNVITYYTTPHVLDKSTVRFPIAVEAPLLAAKTANITTAITALSANSADKKIALNRLDLLMAKYYKFVEPASHSATGYCAEVYPSVGLG